MSRGGGAGPSRAELHRGVERLVAERDKLQGETARFRAEVERLADRVDELEAAPAGGGPRCPGGAAWVKVNSHV